MIICLWVDIEDREDFMVLVTDTEDSVVLVMDTEVMEVLVICPEDPVCSDPDPVDFITGRDYSGLLF